jgi:lipopolysaccharide export system permease protein
VRIISRYVLREHVGPLVFTLTGLTSLLLLNYIARQFGELVGKGLPARVILEFFMLAFPFTIAMTFPMAVLMSVLYAFSRLASENEITAFKASGVSMLRLVRPVLAGGVLGTLLMILFNDQVLPWANHRLATLQRDIFRTKPTFALKEQVVNPIKEGQLYLRAARIERGASQMRDVVLYDLTNAQRRRTVYADSGRIVLAPNQQDLYLTLWHGVMREVPTDKPAEVTQLHYVEDRVRVKDIAASFQRSDQDQGRGEREMTVCDLDRRLAEYERQLHMADYELQLAIGDSVRATRPGAPAPAVAPPVQPFKRYLGIGGVYCRAIERLLPTQAKAAETRSALGSRLSAAPTQDTSRAPRDSARRPAVPRPAAGTPQPQSAGQPPTPPPQRVPGGGYVPPGQPDPSTYVPGQPLPAVPGSPSATPATVPGATPVVPATPVPTPDTARRGATTVAVPPVLPPSVGMPGDARTRDARMNYEQRLRDRNKYAVEIHKKFSLAFACLIFVLVGAPIAVRFPRGGVGLVIGVSLAIFAIYYVGLIGGEALADKGLLSPFWAMWAVNILLLVVGIVMTLRMGREAGSARAGSLRERLDAWQERRAIARERRERGAGTPA